MSIRQANPSVVEMRSGCDLPLTHIRNTAARDGIGSNVDWKEALAYRDLFLYLVRREVKVRYAQSAIGVGWAVLQPLFTMIVFTIVFGRMASISSDGVPYALFSFAGLVPWMFFSNAVTDGVNSLISGAAMMSKVYFPRMFMPLAANAARLIDFIVASFIMALLLAWYGVVPNAGILVLPWVFAVMFLAASGVTLWLATFAIQFRDVKHAMGFLVQILMYAAPVVYPASYVPQEYQRWYALNPMVGVIECIRSGWLGTRDMPWDLLLIGTASVLVLFVSGMSYFNAKQRVFADLA
jgi:lipopolysaccharide transport system permease protein